MTAARVERCRLAYVCGQRWEELEPLPNNERVRFCSRCQASVHLATTPGEFDALAAQGRCVAVPGTASALRVGSAPIEAAPLVSTEELAALSVRLDVSVKEMLRIAGLSERTFARHKQQHKPLTAPESDRVRRMLSATEEAERVFGDARRARAWLKHAHPLLGATPLDMLATDEGAREVRLELTRIDWGDFA